MTTKKTPLPQLYEYPFPQVTMRCEPYIAIKGPRVGEIEWFEGKTPTGASVKLYMDDGEIWQPYADFERGKLKELGGVIAVYDHGYATRGYHSEDLIRYSGKDYDRDSESGRLLARARFLKAVCEREQVEWLPKEQRNTTPEPKPDLPLEAMYGFSQEQWDILRRLWYTPDTYTKAEIDEMFRMKFPHSQN